MVFVCALCVSACLFVCHGLDIEKPSRLVRQTLNGVYYQLVLINRGNFHSKEENPRCGPHHHHPHPHAPPMHWFVELYQDPFTLVTGESGKITHSHSATALTIHQLTSFQ